MLKKPTKRRLKLFFIFWISAFCSLALFAGLSFAKDSSPASQTLFSTPVYVSGEEVFPYKREFAYGKLEKRQDFLSWIVLDRDEIKKNLLKASAAENPPATEKPSTN